MCIYFSQPFNNWLDGAREDLVDMFIVHTMEEIQVWFLNLIDFYFSPKLHYEYLKFPLVFKCCVLSCTWAYFILQGLIDAHEQFKQTLGEADKEHKSITALSQEVQTIATQCQVPGGIENPYTTLTAIVSK